MEEFLPSRFHRGEDRNVVICSDGIIQIIDAEGRATSIFRLQDYSIHSSSASGEFVIVSSTDYGSQAGSHIGIIDVASTEEELSTARKNDGLRGDPVDLALAWQRDLEGTIEALESHGDNIIFSLKGLGVYSMRINKDSEGISVDENWRASYPKWSRKVGAGLIDGIASITTNEGFAQIISEGGEWLMLSLGEGALSRRGFLQISDPVYRAAPLGARGTLVMTRGSRAMLVDNEFNVLYDFKKLPGPVLDALCTEDDLRWTGWRHDGAFSFGSSKLETFPRREIGLGVLVSGLCLCNDGELSEWGYSPGSSVV